MKTLVKTFAIALLSAVSFISNATTDNNGNLNAQKTFAVGVYQTINTMKMNVMVEKLAGKRLSVILKSESGEVLHAEYIRKNDTAYRGKFDLQELEDGKYTFEISDGESKIVKNVQVGTVKPQPNTSDRFMSLN